MPPIPTITPNMWKIISSIGVVVALITSIIGFDSRYVTAGEVTDSIQSLQKQFQIQLDYNRLGGLKAQNYQVMRELRDDPTNPYLKEEKIYVDTEIRATEERLRKNTVGDLN